MNTTTGGSRAAPKRVTSPETLNPDQRLATARRALVDRGVHLVPAAVTTSLLGVTEQTLDRFHVHWDDLSPDHYAAEQGTHRLRRYGRFCWAAATDRVRLLPPTEFVQPENSNPLYIGVSRTLDPLTDSFAADPVLRALLRVLGQVATALDDPAEWIAKVHPFRVIASAGENGSPTPEGRHRDGVSLVSSLLVGRRNAAGGESAVFDPAGARLLTATLSEPGDLLLGDDRRTLHSVSAIRPVDPGRPACRDVLVVTFAPG